MSEPSGWRQSVERIQKDAAGKDRGAESLIKKYEVNALILIRSAVLINSLMKDTHPHLSLPYIQWEKHKTMRDAGLGPIPSEAYYFGHGTEPEEMEKLYAQRILDKMKSV